MAVRGSGLALASHAELRDAERVSATAMIQARQRGARGIRVIAEDISCTGCRVQWPHIVRVGDRVWVTFPGLEATAALVVWTAAFKFGCKFEAPLHAAVFRKLAATSSP
jgi:hypothetical protein